MPINRWMDKEDVIYIYPYIYIYMDIYIFSSMAEYYYYSAIEENEVCHLW